MRPTDQFDVQCDQNGWFSEFLGQKFHHKSSRNVWWLLGYFCKTSLVSKNSYWYFLDRIWKILGYLWFQHLVTLPMSLWKILFVQKKRKRIHSLRPFPEFDHRVGENQNGHENVKVGPDREDGADDGQEYQEKDKDFENWDRGTLHSGKERILLLFRNRVLVKFWPIRVLHFPDFFIVPNFFLFWNSRLFWFWRFICFRQKRFRKSDQIWFEFRFLENWRLWFWEPRIRIFRRIWHWVSFIRFTCSADKVRRRSHVRNSLCIIGREIWTVQFRFKKCFWWPILEPALQNFFAAPNRQHCKILQDYRH